MKYLIPLLVVALPIQSFALEISGASLERLDRHLDASAVQLAMPGTCSSMQKNADFSALVMERAQTEHSPVVNFITPALWTAAGSAVLGGASGLAAVSAAERKDYKALKLFKRVGLGGAGVAVASVAVASTGSMVRDKEDANTPMVLNADKLDTLAKRMARDTAELFSLGLDEEATIRGAIKAEINKKNNIKDESPMDFFAVLKNAKFRNKPVLSPDRQVVLEKMRTAASDEASAKELTVDEKVAALVIATSALDICSKTNNNKALKERVSNNVQLIREMGESFKLGKIKSAEQNEPAEKTHSLNVD